MPNCKIKITGQCVICDRSLIGCLKNCPDNPTPKEPRPEMDWLPKYLEPDLTLQQDRKP